MCISSASAGCRFVWLVTFSYQVGQVFLFVLLISLRLGILEDHAGFCFVVFVFILFWGFCLFVLGICFIFFLFLEKISRGRKKISMPFRIDRKEILTVLLGFLSFWAESQSTEKHKVEKYIYDPSYESFFPDECQF